MLERRRSHLRRSIAAGAVLGMLGTIPLCVIDLVYVLAITRPIFDTTWQAASFVAAVLALPLGFAAVAGAVVGVVLLGISRLADRLAHQRMALPRWTARLYAVLAIPVMAVVTAQLFAGRHARQIHGKQLIALLIGLVGVSATYGMVRMIIAVRDRFRLQRWSKSQALGLALGLVAIGTGFYVTDQRVLTRLYPFFHALLALGAAFFCQLATSSIFAAWRPKSRRAGSLVDPGVALLVVVVTVTLSAWTLRTASRSEALRYLIVEHTAVSSKLLRGLAGVVPTAANVPPSVSPGDPNGRAAMTPLEPGPRRPDASFLLITFDALRADHLGLYGYGRSTTPNIDRWAKSSAVVFERGYCPVPHTSFSVTSLMTGRHMYGVRGGQPQTVASVFRRYGYKTGGFFPPAVFYIDGEHFTHFEKTYFDFEYVKYEFLEAKGRVDQVIDFLRQYGDRKFFVWVHFFEAHEPYEIHDGFRFGTRAVDRYDSEVAYVDHHIGRLLDYLRQNRPNTVIGLTADHGEAFGEHGSRYHGNSLYEEQVRVPLLLSVPNVPHRRVLGPAQTIDLPVTMIGLADVPVPGQMDGNDLGPWLAGAPPDRLPPLMIELNRKKALVSGYDKLIFDTSWNFAELYDLRADPAERVNVAGREPARVAQMRRELGRLMGLGSRTAKRRGGDRETLALLERGRRKNPAAVPGLIGLAGSSDSEVRRQAIALLLAMRARAALEVFGKAADDQDPGVAVPATIGAALLGEHAQADRVARLLRERNDLPPQWRRDALLALAGLGDRSVTVELARVLQRTEDIYDRVEIIDALGQLGDPAAAPAVREQLATLRTRERAISALGKMGARVAVPQLITAMMKDRFVSWRERAARALGRIGDRRAMAPLRAVLRREREVTVVGEALAALSKLTHNAPVTGLRRVRARSGWHCKANEGCVLDLGMSCGKQEDLLLLEGEPRVAIEVRCGEQVIGTLDTAAASSGGEPSASVEEPLPVLVQALSEGSGPLALRTPGKPPVALLQLALRPSPR